MTDTPARSSDAIERVALAGALFSLIVYGLQGSVEVPEPWHLGALLAAAAGLFGVVTRRSWAGTFTLLAVLCVGLREHVAQGDNRASDVMLATNEAVGLLFSGANPYAHTFTSTNPPGSVFGYPPGEIIFYGIVHLVHGNIFRADLTCGILILGLVAALAPFCGVGLAALAVSVLGWDNQMNFHLTDGSNDTAAAFITLAGLTALLWSNITSGRSKTALWWLSAIAFGWAVAFKEYSAPVALFVALYLWRTDGGRGRTWTIAMAGTACAFIVPFLIWSPLDLIRNVGGGLLTHENIWGRNVWHDWISLIPNATAIAPVIPYIALFCILALIVIQWRHPARSASVALLQGLAITACALVMARWTSIVYYNYLVPLIVSAVAIKLGSETVVLDT